LGVDSITTHLCGDLLVAEDGGDLQIVVITKVGSVVPILQLEGYDLSEIAGPEFNPNQSKSKSFAIWVHL
jgi:hypothetical protein